MSNLDEIKQKALQLVPALSFGGLMGLCSGYALKKLGKASAFVAGLGFLALQVLAYNEIITINWSNIQSKTTDFDTKPIVNRILDIIYFQIPSSIGFGLGFASSLTYM